MEIPSAINSEDNIIARRLSFSSEKYVITTEEPNMTCKEVLTLQSVPDDKNSCALSAEVDQQLSTLAVNTCFNVNNEIELKDASPNHRLNSKQQSVNNPEDKENAALPSTPSLPDNNQEEDISGQSSVTACQQLSNPEDSDMEVMRRAQDNDCVNVVFPGTVTQEGCCRFVSEILKCILYQRQQLPMTYDQLVYSQKKQQASMQDEDIVARRPGQSADVSGRKCQQTPQELEEVLFSLSRVPRVLLLMINMEALVLAGGDKSLQVSACLRQLFRTLFVADLLSDTKPVRLIPTTVLVLAHRDCGVGWFRPKLQFKVPTRVKNRIIALSNDPSTCKEPMVQGSDWEDYVWFQAPMTIKGFGK
ncbi:MAD2L1-binding protein [Notothenia coriiceps]|uniref:MAD2L1-binding protein n=1 Tax=Notothenia coriiceps TaxID=8208 RepID=A0A6I9PQ80_9TELE|nr:PREDICTED: MAD2L1-binding protein [Notothenia coriiceps]